MLLSNGKSLVYISEARPDPKERSAVLSKILSYSGGSSPQINRKNLSFYIGSWRGRFVMASNELPQIPDTSGALSSRVIPVHFPKTWFGKEDRTLDAKFEAELPGIMNLVLDALDELTATGHFILSEPSKEVLDRFERLGSPLKEFIHQLFTIGTDRQIDFDDFWREWAGWCMDEKIWSKSRTAIKNDLETLGFSLHQGGGPNGKAKDWIAGLDLSENLPADQGKTNVAQISDYQEREKR